MGGAHLVVVDEKGLEPGDVEDFLGECPKALEGEVHLPRCVVVTEAGSYLRLIDFCITQLKAQGPSRTCNESQEEGEVHLPRQSLYEMCSNLETFWQ